MRRRFYRVSALLLLVFWVMHPGGFSLHALQDRDTLRQEEAREYFLKWLDEDVVYIITDEERSVFLDLTTDEEKNAFIEQFWERRDLNPETLENEFREEHYRRLAYANDHYSVGLPGWKSDRGRVYIINGPPDSIESHDQGEQYYRPMTEGGGVTTTYAWELWYYRHIEGIGDGIEVEFVDKSMSGHFTLARDEMDRDAFLWVPGLGLTESERLGGGTKAERIGTRTLANFASRRVGNPLKIFTQKDDLFQRLHRYARIQSAPEIKFKDLEGLIDVQLYYNQLPFSVRYDLIRITPEDYLVPVTFFFETEQFNFQESGNIRQASVNVYGRVETLSRAKVYAFDDVVHLSQRQDQTSSAFASVYQRGIPLKSGRYKLIAVVKDTNQGKIGTREVGIYVPPGPESELDMSPIILADLVQPARQGEFISDPFILGTVKVYPTSDHEFRRGDPLGFYFEVYNVAADQQTLEPTLAVDLTIERNGKEVPLPFRDLHRLLHRYSDRFFTGSMLSTQPLEPGDYSMKIVVVDKVAGTETAKTVKFKIV